MSELIKVKNLNFGYEAGYPVLSAINFAANQVETIGLIGANGVGKSTLLRLLVGLELEFDGEILVGKNEEKLALNRQNLSQIRSKIGYVFQDSDSQLFTQNVYEDVAFGPRSQGLSENEVEARVNKALELTNIAHLKTRPIHKMSGGEKKLASLATILSMEPEIILLDEPTIALDPKNRRNIINTLNILPQTKIIATHDLDMVLDTCDRVLLMKNGSIISDGAPSEILSNRNLLEESGLELPLSLMATCLTL